MGNRNRVLFVDHRMEPGYTRLSNEFIRHAGHPNELGRDGFMLVAYLVSCVSGPDQEPWETSGQAMSELFGWSRSGERVKSATERAEKHERLVLRKYVRDGIELQNRWDYVVCPGGRKFTDRELLLWSRPIEC